MIHVRLNIPSPAFRAGVRALLASATEISVSGDGQDDGTDPVKSTADVIVTTSAVDSELSQYASTARRPAVLFLRTEPLSIERVVRSQGVWGVLDVDASAEELSAAIHALAAGLFVGSSALLTADGEAPSSGGPLTDREAEVLGLLARGLANKRIAVELGISEHTVKFHVSSIYNKLDASSRTQAVREGLRRGLIAL